MQQVKAVIVREKDAPAELTTITVPDPGPGEALVKVLTCGVCQTDMHYQKGGVGDDFPYLLGHEASGIVEAVGEDVTGVAVGDHVILNWRAVCGQCRACRRGEPWYCFDTHNAHQKMTLEDGTELEPALGIGAFAEKTLVHQGQCTKVDPSVDPAVAVGLEGRPDDAFVADVTQCLGGAWRAGLLRCGRACRNLGARGDEGRPVGGVVPRARHRS